MAARLALCVALAAVTAHAALFVPGTMRDYAEGENVEILANTLSSVNTHLPYDYYSVAHHCLPRKESRGNRHNLGEVLLGDRIVQSPYEDLHVGENVECAVVCPARKHKEADTKILVDRIAHAYHVNLILDNLPVATVHENGLYSVGVPLGVVENKVPYVFNHLELTVKYYELTPEELKKKFDAEKKKNGKSAKLDDENTPHYRIISFVGRPLSIKHDAENPEKTTCDPSTFRTKERKPQEAVTDTPVTFSYSVKWEKTDETWATRWDVYLNMEDHDIHWVSIINSVLIVVLLTSIVAGIFVRTLRRDIVNYNKDEMDPDDLQDEAGWKMVHKDVFRTPEHGWLLSALTGTGSQLFGMTWTVLIFAGLGFLSPAARGSLFTAVLVIFVFLGMFAGFTSARLLKTWGQASWLNILATATVVPGITFATFFVVNLAVWSQKSSGAVPFASMLAVIALWFCISLPLVFVGAVAGFKMDALKFPVPVSQIPRHIPPPQWHLQPWFTIPVAGVLPFGAVFIEIFFIFTAVWLNRYYYVFGFLILVFVILMVTCVEITIVMTYFQLCAEDYQWWWRSFLMSGSCGVYVFLYAVFYFFTSSLQMTSFVPILLYFSYMALISFIFSVLTGTIGFAATFAFVRYMYSSIKVD